MPKTLKITGNNLKLRYGWFPPIPDTENAANQYHGGADFFKNRGNFDVFRKILKENMGFAGDVKDASLIPGSGKFSRGGHGSLL